MSKKKPDNSHHDMSENEQILASVRRDLVHQHINDQLSAAKAKMIAEQAAADLKCLEDDLRASGIDLATPYGKRVFLLCLFRKAQRRMAANRGPCQNGDIFLDDSYL